MNTYLLLSGYQLWAAMILLLVIIVAVISLGRGYLEQVHKNERLRRLLQAAKEDAADWQSRYTTLSYSVIGGRNHDEN